jgi:hypothetical protein
MPPESGVDSAMILSVSVEASVGERRGMSVGSCDLFAAALGSYLQVAYTFTAESFPTRWRATGFALSDGIGHIGGAVGALLLPVVVREWSFFGGFATIAVRGRRLEEISR